MAAQQRLAFLAEASALLATSLDPQVTLDQIAWLAVPKLADICLVLLAEGGELRPAAIAYKDTGNREPLDHLLAGHPWKVDADGVFCDALRAGRSRLWTELGDDIFTGAEQGDHRLARLHELDLASGMLVPLVGREERLGMIAFGRQRDGRAYAAADISLAEDLAVRAGTALDTARRFDDLASRLSEPS
jgi:GAF domain-containing protein